MGSVADRIKDIIATKSETLSFTKLAGSGVGQPFAVKAFVEPMDSNLFDTYFDATELAMLAFPVLLCRAAGDSTVIVGDLFPRGGVNHIVDTVFLYNYELVGAVKMFLATIV